MKAVIFGATGMVGSEVLSSCLHKDEFTKVVTVGRRTTGKSHPKLLELKHQDFRDYSAIESELADADICYYCLGVYQGQVSKEMFWEITVEYMESLVSTFERLNPDIKFCLFSAQGANPKETSLMTFANAKGRAEAILSSSSLASKFIFRPGFIAPRNVATKQTFSIRLFKPVYWLFPRIGIDAADLARIMVNAGIAGGSDAILENSDMRDKL